MRRLDAEHHTGWVNSMETPQKFSAEAATDRPAPVQPPQYHAMAAFDICGFGNSGDPNVMRHMRSCMYQVIQSAAETAQMRWVDCEYEDRGDGLYLLAPPGYSVHSLVDPLAPLIRRGLGQVNRTLSVDHRLRLRMAVHHGELVHDEHGVVSPDLNTLFRLLDAPVLRARFEQGDLALIVSEDVYRRVVRWGTGLIDQKEFEPLLIDYKKTLCVAWAALPPQPASAPAKALPDVPPDVLGNRFAILALLESLMERARDLLQDDGPS
ncbi:hypothetical protein [Actinomadura rubrisoli]|uniref:Guanylate cyclase domain-containing protein n=1 Tax=Actinomadura rubrisoli TaxID=2530368 RepID=A0A4R4ZWL0_9ACTN|nr:hypothetical protein [Actinomadura rubrisoli]TDD62950.1 hypothetical protein E1298_44250 [Actinomadura rubrisoli]